jgi:hypothetical protein
LAHFGTRVWVFPGFLKSVDSNRLGIQAKLADFDRGIREIANGIWWVPRTQGMILKRHLRRKKAKAHPTLEKFIRDSAFSWEV